MDTKRPKIENIKQSTNQSPDLFKHVQKSLYNNPLIPIWTYRIVKNI